MKASNKSARLRGIKGLAVAAGLAVLGTASQAAAWETFTLVNASMNQSYRATIYNSWINGYETGISNGVTFNVSGYDTPPTTTLFGFCIDIYHNMYVNTTLNYTYETNQDTGGGLVTNTGTTLDETQITAISRLVNTGFALHAADPNGAETALKTAAIQAAIWAIEVPGAVTLVNPNAVVGGSQTYQYFFDHYVSGDYVSSVDANDKVFTIRDGAHQSFAIGWPVDGVPEPSTWAMMLMGFGGLGAVLRSRRKLAAAAI